MVSGHAELLRTGIQTCMRERLRLVPGDARISAAGPRRVLASSFADAVTAGYRRKGCGRPWRSAGLQGDGGLAAGCVVWRQTHNTGVCRVRELDGQKEARRYCIWPTWKRC